MTAPPETQKGIDERERLRPHRVQNYAVKRAANFICEHDGCSTNEGVLVVKRDGELTTRCQPHLGRLKPEPGQWIDRRLP